MTLWLALSVALGAEGGCRSVAPLLEATNRALLDVETAEAEKRLKAAEEALLACEERFDPEVLAELWLLEGVLRTVQEDAEAATDAFAAAHRASPGRWDDAYGPAMRAQYDAARQESTQAGRVELVPALGSNQAWLDGAAVAENPVEMPSGLHALQVADASGAVQWSQILWVPPNERMRIDTEVPTGTAAPAPAPEPVVGPEPEPPKPASERPRRKIDPLIVGGAGAVVAGGVLLGVSVERSAAMDDATSYDDLRARYHEHAGTRISGLGLLGLGVAAVGVGFAF
ncbi:MAG: hypothetical protein H6737_20660 [Alphaproteobacteria bacterium]|nr:hypothetical protein [Alphaproteobacteria bacterium]